MFDTGGMVDMSWGLESLGSGIANLPQGPVGRQHKRDQHWAHDESVLHATHGLIWKANQLKALGINPAVLGGSEGSRPMASAGGSPNASGIGRGLGQLGDTLINKLANKESRGLQNDLTKAEINYKNASAEALRASTVDKNAGQKPSDIEVVPSKTIKNIGSNPGVEAASKSGNAVSVMEDGTIKLHANQELAEALESQGVVDRFMDLLHDSKRTATVLLSNRARSKMKPWIIDTLRKTDRLKPNETIFWNGTRFQIGKPSKTRSTREEIKAKRYKRNKRNLQRQSTGGGGW